MTAMASTCLPASSGLSSDHSHTAEIYPEVQVPPWHTHLTTIQVFRKTFAGIRQTLVDLVLSDPIFPCLLPPSSPTSCSSCSSKVSCRSAPLGPFMRFPLDLCLPFQILCYCWSLRTDFPDDASEKPPSYLLFPVNTIQAPRLQLAFFAFSFVEIQSL